MVTSTLLPWVSILFARRKGETFPKSSAITAIGKNITLTSIRKIKRRSQKLVTILVTSTPVIIAGKEEVGKNPGSNLAQVLCICYPINFGMKSVSALLDSSSEIKTIYPAFPKELGFSIRPTNVGVRKIDGTMLETYEMVVAAFLVENKANRVRFFEETFLVANVSPEVVL